MKVAIICSIERAPQELQYEEMGPLLAMSIRKFHPTIDIHCGIFSDKEPRDSIIEELRNWDVNIHRHIKFKDPNRTLPNYLLKTYTQYYFYKQLAKEYDYLIYLDIDLVILKPIDFNYLESRNIMIDMSKEIQYLEDDESNIDKSKDFYVNFIHIIRSSDKIEKFYKTIDETNDKYNYNSLTKLYEFHKTYLNNVYNPRICSYFPNLPINEETIFFHYDGFHECSTLNRIPDEKLKISYMEYIKSLGVDNLPDGFYQETKILENIKVLMPYILKNKPELNSWLKEYI